MGYGAIIGAIGSIAGSVIGDVANSSKGGGQTNLSGVTLASPETAGLGAFLAQQQQWPALTDFTNTINQQATAGYTGLINTLYPGATSQLGQISSLAGGYLKGQIPADVQAQIQRATAQQAMSGGYAGTGQAANLTARDIGMTSVDLTQLGANMYGTGVGAAKGMIPGYVNPASLLFSPSQLLARTDQANYYNTDVANQQQIINAQLAEKQAVSTQTGTTSMLSSLFGSGSGSSGGSVGNLFSGLSNLGGGGGVGNTNPQGYDLNTMAGSEAYVGI